MRSQHTSTEKSTSQAKIKQEQEAHNQQEGMKHAPTRQQEKQSTVHSQVGESPVQDTTVQSSYGNIKVSSDSIRTITGQVHATKLKCYCS